MLEKVWALLSKQSIPSAHVVLLRVQVFTLP
jgi:hypothetical protein